MKNCILLIAIAAFLFSYSLHAQNETGLKDAPPKVQNEDIAPIFISISGGINHTGILGVGLEYPIQDQIAVFADVGIGGWGFKAGFGGSYYFNNIRKGSSLNLAYYFASGTGNQPVEIADEDGIGRLVVYNPVGTINLTYAQNWNLGRKGKFALIGGYAIGTGKKENAYQYQNSNYIPTDFDKTVLNVVHPDGLILGIKFLFGVGGG